MKVWVLYVIMNAAVGRPDVEVRVRPALPTLAQCEAVGREWLAQKRPSGDPAKSYVCRPEMRI